MFLLCGLIALGSLVGAVVLIARFDCNTRPGEAVGAVGGWFIEGAGMVLLVFSTIVLYSFLDPAAHIYVRSLVGHSHSYQVQSPVEGVTWSGGEVSWDPVNHGGGLLYYAVHYGRSDGKPKTKVLGPDLTPNPATGKVSWSDPVLNDATEVQVQFVNCAGISERHAVVEQE